MSVLRLNVCSLCVPNKKLHVIKVGAFAWYSVKICVIFDVRFERRKVNKKSKPTWKLKHAISILECFEYFWSKSILTILSYTISKSVHFFLRHSILSRSVHRLVISSRRDVVHNALYAIAKWPSLPLSVRHDRYSVKTAKHIVEILSPPDSHIILVTQKKTPLRNSDWIIPLMRS